jgi:predicted GIY-YIG superfamily endonuclease
VKVRTALYRFFDACDALLYVGVTGDVDARWEQHASLKPWWPQVTRKTVEWYDDRETAESEERRAIREEDPLHNVQHAPRLNPVTRVTWWGFVMRVSGNASQSDIARKSGLSQPSVSQWRKSAPKPASVQAFAAAYEVPAALAFIAGGYFTDAELREFCGCTEPHRVAIEFGLAG